MEGKTKEKKRERREKTKEGKLYFSHGLHSF
jgi:hypothetical protein